MAAASPEGYVYDICQWQHTLKIQAHCAGASAHVHVCKHVETLFGAENITPCLAIHQKFLM
jgi:hypothetical protein